MYHSVLAINISYWNLSLPPWPYRFSFLLNSSIPSWTLTFLVRPITSLWNLPLTVWSYHSSLNSSIPSLTLHLLISSTIPSRTIYIITPSSLLFLIRPYHSSLICTLPSRTLHSSLNSSVTSWTLPSPSLNSVIPSWALPITKSYHSLQDPMLTEPLSSIWAQMWLQWSPLCVLWSGPSAGKTASWLGMSWPGQWWKWTVYFIFSLPVGLKSIF